LPPESEQREWDKSCDRRFYDYYASKSQSEATLLRFESIRDAVLRVLRQNQLPTLKLDVADIGCGAGTQSFVWATSGHNVHAIDINEPLLSLAKDRAAKYEYDIEFRVGSATALPWPNGSMNVCLVPEVLEHVQGWQTCLDEFTRVLRPGGLLFLTTTNRLCPIQEEFTLPLYSWYPARLKRYYEGLATGERPEIVNYAKYPAVNWFSFYGLRAELGRRGLRSLDRFDVMNMSGKSLSKRVLASLIRALPPMRLLAHFASPGTMIVGIKEI
jgi:2-polyprenyl-6-hydroxyphenyl methylase/3-demethylubiquinone-9 3-methyltransferase